MAFIKYREGAVFLVNIYIYYITKNLTSLDHVYCTIFKHDYCYLDAN